MKSKYFIVKSDVIKQQIELIKIREKMKEQKEQELEEGNKPEEKEEKKEDDNKKEEYINRFKEAHRVTTKVGYKEDIKAMNEIKKGLMKKGFNL